MDQAGGVRRVEGVRDLADPVERLVGLHRPRGREHGREVLAAHEAHREEERAVELARVVDRDHVRVVERRRQARLAQEAVAEVGVARQLGHEHLQGDGPAEVHVLGAEHDAHAAAAELIAEAIAAEPVAARR